MSKRIKIIIAVAVLCIATAVTFVVIKMNADSIQVEQVIGNYEWGMSIEEVKSRLAQEGITDYSESGAENVTNLFCNCKDYQGIEGADYTMYLQFVDGKLSYGMYSFGTNREGKGILSKDMLQDIVTMWSDAYESGYNESLNEPFYSRRGPKDMDYSRNFIGDKSLVHVSRGGEEQFSVHFSDINEEGMEEYIATLRFMQETKAKSPTGFYDGEWVD